MARFVRSWNFCQDNARRDAAVCEQRGQPRQERAWSLWTSQGDATWSVHTARCGLRCTGGTPPTRALRICISAPALARRRSGWSVRLIARYGSDGGSVATATEHPGFHGGACLCACCGRSGVESEVDRQAEGGRETGDARADQTGVKGLGTRRRGGRG